MSQSLLGWILSRAGDHGCASWLHVHVAPAGNLEFLDRVTAPPLRGADVTEAWRQILRRPELYVATTPEKLLAPIARETGAGALANYLRRRYWDSD